MFTIDTDKTISITRGDSGSFVAPIDYALQSGDVLRLKVFRKKACEDVVLQKDFAIGEATKTVTLELTEKDTRIGGVISKPVDYWYEIELNPDTNPQTIVGYDEDGAKIFRLYPEGRDMEDDELTEEEVDTFRKLFGDFKNEIYDYVDEACGDGGADGKDGVSITSVEQTTTSAEDGGNNVITVTLSDDTTSTFTVKNGSKGSQGSNGADGYTPVKGTDYFTEADKAEMVNDVKNVCVAKNQGSENVGKILVVGTDGNLTLANMPEGGASGDVIGVLDESNNILLSGNLSDGKYTLKYENTDGTYTEVGELVIGEIEPPKTNFFVVGGDGYLNPGRASGKGEDRTDVTTCLLSNYIEVQYGDIVYVEGLVLDTKATSFSGIYKTDKSGGVGITIATDTTYLQDTAFSENGGQFTIKWANAGFIRICGAIPSDVNNIVVNIQRNGEWL